MFSDAQFLLFLNKYGFWLQLVERPKTHWYKNSRVYTHDIPIERFTILVSQKLWSTNFVTTTNCEIFRRETNKSWSIELLLYESRKTRFCGSLVHFSDSSSSSFRPCFNVFSFKAISLVYVVQKKNAWIWTWGKLLLRIWGRERKREREKKAI